MHQPLEFSIELSDQELTTPPAPEGLIEIDDICGIDTIESAALAANLPPTMTLSGDDLVEIELTAQEMDALLSGDWKPA